MPVYQRYAHEVDSAFQNTDYWVWDVERRPGFDLEAQAMKKTGVERLGLPIRQVRVFYRYEMLLPKGFVPDARFEAILAEPPTDTLRSTPTPLPEGVWAWGMASLPGQYDARASAASDAIELLTGHPTPVLVSTGVLVEGDLTQDDKARFEAYFINPVESEKVDLNHKAAFGTVPAWEGEVLTVPLLEKTTPEALERLRQDWGLAMSVADLEVMREYFLSENRNPTETELRVLDTYWSDHCRHTTFNTAFARVEILDPRVKASWDRYEALRQALGRTHKPKHLMDVATLGARALKQTGQYAVDESEEINAAAIRVNVRHEVDGLIQDEPWIYYFKNETHNHPTEIEPFGGAATCLGGAIRDPLSGRSYVYQSARVTGAGNPLASIQSTRTGKRPQQQITTLAAKGFSAYGNQIGLATGFVDELYHPGYEAKRLEVGAVVGAAKAENVIRKTPKDGDLVVLVGGATGRDGCGGATGSSKTHHEDSVHEASSEVQKGNPVEERKLQRLFRHPQVARSIKRCNDFGAGGVCVAIGELAAGVHVYLERVPKKYVGLSPTELAISESQERMACVIDPQDWETFKAYAEAENVDATVVAKVTEAPTLVMTYQAQEVVRLERAFLDKAGAARTTDVVVEACPRPPASLISPKATFTDTVLCLAKDLNVCSKAGLIQHFDSTIGAGTVVMPLGGQTQLTPSQVMAATLPVTEGSTTTTSVLSYGFDPYEVDANPYQGAYEAITESVMKLMACGVPYQPVYLSLQEYFPSLRQDPHRWGRPLAALLGALDAQMDWTVPAIGGKDSMSGSFENLDVPATLISFATTVTDASFITTPELKAPGHKLYRLSMARLEDGRIDSDKVASLWNTVSEGFANKTLVSGWAVSRGGLLEGFIKMSLGNRIGVQLKPELTLMEMVSKSFGSLIVESVSDLPAPFEYLGVTVEENALLWREEKVDLGSLECAYTETLEGLFPTRPSATPTTPPMAFFDGCRTTYTPRVRSPKPRALLPVFPGTNCEVDTARALKKAGAEVDMVLVRNRTPSLLAQSVEAMLKAVDNSQLIVFPGGFSLGDEPDGSGKFIAAFFKHPQLQDKVMRALTERDALMLGICNGFQALIKLGLLPYGEIRNLDKEAATLTYNTIGRHQSGYVHTRVASVRSPWMMGMEVGDIHTIAISHGEGRFVCPPELFAELVARGQIATQYVDLSGEPTYEAPFNPNGSFMAVEGIFSPDGRVMGKMGHSERVGPYLAKNIEGNHYQPLFENGVKYFQ